MPKEKHFGGKLVITSRKKTNYDSIVVMNIPTIIQQGQEPLHKKADSVPVSEIVSTNTQSVIIAMKKALAGEPDGVAIAAPQIAVSKRIFVVAGFVFEKGHPDVVFINPEITKRSKKTELMEEGCLSVRYIYGQVKRHKNVTIKAYTENGEQITRGAGGLLAQIFQHEIDHLDGILFVDKAEEYEEISDKEKEKLDNKRNDAKKSITK